MQAVDEATTNVILHGYRGGPGWVEVAAERVGDRIVVTVTDEAPSFDPTRVPEPDLSVPPERRRPGGMGIHLIREATDRPSTSHDPAAAISDVGPAPRSTPEGGAFMSMQTTIEQVEVPFRSRSLRSTASSTRPTPGGVIDTVRRLYGEGTRQLIIDLAGLRFMASSGLVALHSIVQIMHEEEPLDPEGGWGHSTASVATSRPRSDWQARSPRSNRS